MHKIMKFFIKIFFIIVVVTGIYSCEDPLKEVAYFELTEDLAFGTQEDALAAINSIYEPLIAVTNRDIFYLNDIASDGGYRANENAEILNFNKLNESQDVVWSWEGYYTLISRANIAIPNIEKIAVEKFYAKDVTITDQVIEDAKALKARYLAEAYFLRGWAYYQLTDIFYKVPLNLTFEKEARNIPLSSIEDIEAQIISDLLEAEKSLPETYPTNKDAGRATVGAAQGMLCRVYMRAAGRMRLSGNGDANANWQNALTYANKVLALESKGVYVLQKRVWDIFNPDLEATKYNKELNPAYSLEINGHSDSQGDDYKNLVLSQQRADAVKLYLVGKGINEDRMTSKGYGETMPVADNSTAAGRAKNRRVEFKVVF
jgi:hypothetical protein